MTLQASGTMTDAHLMAELRTVNPSRAYPLSLTDADVLALAGKAGAPVTFPTDFYGKSAGGAGGGGGTFAVSASNAANSALTDGAGGSVACNPGVAASGGSGNYSYLWSFTNNPNGCALSNAASAACTVAHSYSANTNGAASATLQCIVTDTANNTSVTKTGITADLSWTRF